MANQIAPFGLQDAERREGASPMYGQTRYAIGSSDATQIYNGDVVVPSLITPVSGNFAPYITQGSSGPAGPIVGVFRGCEYLNNAVGRVVWSPYWPAANAGADAIAYVIDDDRMLFIAQLSSGAILGSSQVGLNLQTLQAANSVAMSSAIGNPASGQSGVSLASSTIGTSSSYPFRLVDFFSNWQPSTPQFPVPPPAGGYPFGTFVNGTDNTTPGQIVVVAANNWATKTTTGL